jgi:hypothetical protein
VIRRPFLFGSRPENINVVMLRKSLCFTLVLISLSVTKVRALEPTANDETRAHWSFQPIQRPSIPFHTPATEQRNEIDTFIFYRLRQAGLQPAPVATKETLLRRAYYDLTGLPPSPAEVKAFLADSSPLAFEFAVDRLLASPHYGEKWARHWLDLVRYAESDSYERDRAKPYVWHYRDYVIRSFNEDKPYQQFVREQLAGDELEQVTVDSITATGFYRLGIWQDEPVDHIQELYEDLDDLVRTTGEVFLGLTIGCARCHDHKLDPLPQRDYYRLLAFFRNVERYGIRSHASVHALSVREVDAPVDPRVPRINAEDIQKEVKEIQGKRKSILKQLQETMDAQDYDQFQNESNRPALLKKFAENNILRNRVHLYEVLGRAEHALLNHPLGDKRRVLCVTERGINVPATHVLARGNAHAAGEQVVPGFPTVLNFPDPKIEPPSPGAKSCGRRLALANWIVSPDNPLTARVIVNRLWQYHFGQGIVHTPNNFGLQGETPTHPELLDWLANELITGGWKLKPLHRQMMFSRSYQMNSRPNPAGQSRDPQNNLLWRFPMRRLTVEEIRDSVLAVNQSINPVLYGTSIYPLVSDEVKAGQSQPGDGWKESTPAERNRRSIYIHTKRSLVLPLIETFDGPDLDTTCPVRFSTVQPTQALAMINGELFNRHAKILAIHVRRSVGNQLQQQVGFVLQGVLQRRPSQQEIEQGVQLVTRLQKEYNVDASLGLDHFCLMAFNLNEFVYLD